MMAVAKKVRLDKLVSNPHRDFEDFPIRPDDIQTLINSYNTAGDFGVIVARPVPGSDLFEIAAGHHRAEAMRQMGWLEADVKVMTLSDFEMVRVMALENATQRGAKPEANLNNIAAITEVLAYQILRWETWEDFKANADKAAVSLFNGGNPPGKMWGQVRARLQNGQGIGRRLINTFLTGNKDKSPIPEDALRTAVGEFKDVGKLKKIMTRVITRISEEELRLKERREAERKAEEEAQRKHEARMKKIAEDEKKAKAAAQKEAERKAAIAEARRKREAEEAAERQRKLEEQRKAKEAERKRQEELKAKLEQDQALKQQKKAVLSDKAINKFSSREHREFFRSFIKGSTVFNPEMHEALADSVIEGAIHNKGSMTLEGIKMALSLVQRKGEIWSKELQREEEEYWRKVREREEAKRAETKVGRLEDELRIRTRDLQETVIEYTTFLKNTTEAEKHMNMFKYRQDVRTLINALVAFDKMFGGKLDYYFDDIEKVQN